MGDEGVLALVCDSTNVFNPNPSGSEGAVHRGLMDASALTDLAVEYLGSGTRLFLADEAVGEQLDCLSGAVVRRANRGAASS